MTRRQATYWAKRFARSNVADTIEYQDSSMDPESLRDIYYLELIWLTGDRATCYGADDCRRELAWWSHEFHVRI